VNKSKYIVPILFLFFVTLSACKNQAQEKDNFNLTAGELITAMKTDSNLVILDVRTPQELVGQHGHIEGVINIPIQALYKRVSEMEEHKDKNIAVICLSGYRSVIATKIMINNGFKAKNVVGGMKAYNELK